MTYPKPHWPVTEERINIALNRIKNGYAPMRIPAEPTDYDLVISDCWSEISALKLCIAELEGQLAEFRNHCGNHQAAGGSTTECQFCRAEAAESRLSSVLEVLRNMLGYLLGRPNSDGLKSVIEQAESALKTIPLQPTSFDEQVRSGHDIGCAFINDGGPCGCTGLQPQKEKK